MTGAGDSFGELRAGDQMGPLTLPMSRAANERYWRAAGCDHELLRAGTLYPLIAANCSVLTFGMHCSEAMIQTRQQLVCHRQVLAPATLYTTGTVEELYERRGLDYLVARFVVRSDDATGAPIWTSTVTFTPARSLANRK